MYHILLLSKYCKTLNFKGPIRRKTLLVSMPHVELFTSLFLICLFVKHHFKPEVSKMLELLQCHIYILYCKCDALQQKVP